MLISDPTKGRHRTPQTRTKATARHALSPVRTRRPLKPTPHRAASPFRTYAATAAALALAVGLASAISGQGGHADAAVTATTIVTDDFARTVNTGLGSAPQGGAYSVTGSGSKVFSVSTLQAGQGLVTNLAPRSSAGGWLPAVQAGDVSVQVSFSYGTTSKGAAGLTSGVEARRQRDGQAYRAKLSFMASGLAYLGISRIGPKQVETSLGGTGLPWSLDAGARANLELKVTGTSTISVQARAWRATDAAPGWGLTYSDNSTSKVSAAGAIGLWEHRNGSGTASGLRIDSLSATKFVTSTASSPTATSSAAPTSTTSSSTTPASTSAAAPTTTTSSSTTPASTSAAAPTTTSPSPTPTATSSAAPLRSASGRTIPAIPAAGSAAVGTARFPVPANAVYVSPSGSDANPGSLAAPWKTLGHAIQTAAAGATIVLRAGTYHESVTVFKTDQIIQNYPGEAVWLDGSSVVTGWVRSGSTWVKTGWTAEFDHSESFSRGTVGTTAEGWYFVNPAYPMAAWPDMVFVDGKSLVQVSSAATPGPGQFKVDYAANSLTIGSDPTGHEVRGSDLPIAITLAATDQQLRGVGVRRYATSLPDMGTVRLFGGNDALTDVYVADNATEGVSVYKSGSRLTRITTTRNGMTGIHANQADGLVIDGAMTDHNNTEHFMHSPAAGGMKITRTNGVVVKNTVAANQYDATGIWTDESVRNFTIVNNYSINNRNGIETELSGTGIVANNVIVGGEHGIWLHDSGMIQVFNNEIYDTTNKAIAITESARKQATTTVGRDPRMPVPDPTCTWQTTDIVIANNVFDHSGGFQVWALDTETNIPVDSWRLTVDGNVFAYRADTSQARLMAWGGMYDKLTYYDTPAALASAKNPSWTNMMTTTGDPAAPAVDGATVSTAKAVPLPSAVASAVGVGVGTQHLGHF
jgi:parallel beta-helix repeat protein